MEIEIDGDNYPCSNENTISVDIIYPQESPEYLLIGMIHTRSTDGFRTHYDFNRDGWVIEQQPFRRIPGCLINRDSNGYEYSWQEVAFIKSWDKRLEMDE